MIRACVAGPGGVGLTADSAAAGWELAADRGAGASGGRSKAGISGEVAGGAEGAAVADVEQDAGCGPEPDAWHGGQDLGKRVCIKDLFDQGGDLGPLIQHGRVRPGKADCRVTGRAGAPSITRGVQQRSAAQKEPQNQA